VILGSLVAAPFTLGASTAVAATAVGTGAVVLGATGAVFGADDAERYKRESGLSEEFVRQVGGMVQSGQSAVLFVAAGRAGRAGPGDAPEREGGALLSGRAARGRAARGRAAFR
jgi:hypothetical protein